MGSSHGNTLIQEINNDFEILKFNLAVVKKILKIINKNSKKMLELLLYNEKHKNFKIFFSRNKMAFSLLFYQKNIQKNLRAIFIYSTYRLLKIKTLYWSNKYKFTCFIFKNNLNCNELNFLQNYDKLLFDYSNQINIEMSKNLSSCSSSFISNFNQKKKSAFYK